jgi:hypothetical protein
MRSTFRSKRSAFAAKSATPTRPRIVVSSSFIAMSPTSAEVFVSLTLPAKLSCLRTFGSVVRGGSDADLRQPLAQRQRIELDRAL